MVFLQETVASCLHLQGLLQRLLSTTTIDSKSLGSDQLLNEQQLLRLACGRQYPLGVDVLQEMIAAVHYCL